MAINKVVYGATVLVDLTSDTVDAAHLAKGYTAHDAGGNLIVGALEQQRSENLLSGITPYLLEGTRQNGKTYVIPAGYVNGTEYIEYELNIPTLTSDVTYGVFVSGYSKNDFRAYAPRLYYRDASGSVTYNPVSSVYFTKTPDVKVVCIKLASGTKPMHLDLIFAKSQYPASVFTNVMLVPLDF